MSAPPGFDPNVSMLKGAGDSPPPPMIAMKGGGLPANYVDGGYKESLLPGGNAPIQEMHGGKLPTTGFIQYSKVKYTKDGKVTFGTIMSSKNTDGKIHIKMDGEEYSKEFNMDDENLEIVPDDSLTGKPPGSGGPPPGSGTPPGSGGPPPGSGTPPGNPPSTTDPSKIKTDKFEITLQEFMDAGGTVGEFNDFLTKYQHCLELGPTGADGAGCDPVMKRLRIILINRLQTYSRECKFFQSSSGGPLGIGASAKGPSAGPGSIIDGTKPDGTKPDGTKPDGAKPSEPQVCQDIALSTVNDPAWKNILLLFKVIFLLPKLALSYMKPPQWYRKIGASLKRSLFFPLTDIQYVNSILPFITFNLNTITQKGERVTNFDMIKQSVLYVLDSIMTGSDRINRDISESLRNAKFAGLTKLKPHEQKMSLEMLIDFLNENTDIETHSVIELEARPAIESLRDKLRTKIENMVFNPESKLYTKIEDAPTILLDFPLQYIKDLGVRGKSIIKGTLRKIGAKDPEYMVAFHRNKDKVTDPNYRFSFIAFRPEFLNPCVIDVVADPNKKNIDTVMRALFPDAIIPLHKDPKINRALLAIKAFIAQVKARKQAKQGQQQGGGDEEDTLALLEAIEKELLATESADKITPVTKEKMTKAEAMVQGLIGADTALKSVGDELINAFKMNEINATALATVVPGAPSAQGTPSAQGITQGNPPSNASGAKEEGGPKQELPSTSTASPVPGEEGPKQELPSTSTAKLSADNISLPAARTIALSPATFNPGDILKIKPNFNPEFLKHINPAHIAADRVLTFVKTDPNGYFTVSSKKSDGSDEKTISLPQNAIHIETQLNRNMAAVTEGKLTAPLPESPKSELEQLFDSLKPVVESIEEIIGNERRVKRNWTNSPSEDIKELKNILNKIKDGNTKITNIEIELLAARFPSIIEQIVTISSTNLDEAQKRNLTNYTDILIKNLRQFQAMRASEPKTGPSNINLALAAQRESGFGQGSAEAASGQVSAEAASGQGSAEVAPATPVQKPASPPLTEQEKLLAETQSIATDFLNILQKERTFIDKAGESQFISENKLKKFMNNKGFKRTAQKRFLIILEILKLADKNTSSEVVKKTAKDLDNSKLNSLINYIIPTSNKTLRAEIEPVKEKLLATLAKWGNSELPTQNNPVQYTGDMFTGISNSSTAPKAVFRAAKTKVKRSLFERGINKIRGFFPEGVTKRIKQPVPYNGRKTRRSRALKQLKSGELPPTSNERNIKRFNRLAFGPPNGTRIPQQNAKVYSFPTGQEGPQSNRTLRGQSKPKSKISSILQGEGALVYPRQSIQRPTGINNREPLPSKGGLRKKHLTRAKAQTKRLLKRRSRCN